MLSDKIKELRKNKGLSQQGLAKKLDISPSTIAMIESGKREGNKETLSKIASYFGVTLDYLYGMEEKKVIIQKDKSSIIENFIDDLIDEGIITDPDKLDEQTSKMILNAVKAQIALRMQKKGK